MPRSSSNLFADGDLLAALSEQVSEVQEKINRIPTDQFLASPDDEIVGHILSQWLVEPLEIHEGRMVMTSPEEVQVVVRPGRSKRQVRVSGTRVTIKIPFTGDVALWRLRPSRLFLRVPKAVVKEPRSGVAGHLEIVIERPLDMSEEIQRDFESTLALVKEYLTAQRVDIEQHNAQLEGHIRDAIRERRERLEKQEGIVRLLNIPLERRDGVPEIAPLRVERRLVRPLPPPPKSGFRAEPGISERDYEDILTIIRHEGRTFETTPATYAVHDETELRDILLAHLNGHYEGGATGETFRARGRTDIRIEAEDRAAFVAECKVWEGAQSLVEAIDQLLGYLTWRDCKCAIVVFNKRNARFTELLVKVPGVFKEHPRGYAELGAQGNGEWRYVLTAEEDEARRIVVHVFLFNLYVQGRLKRRPAPGPRPSPDEAPR